MATTKRGVNVSCLDCGHRIHLDFRPGVGHIVTCPTCETEMEITSAKPLKFDFYFEDWEEDGEGEADEDWEEIED